MIQQKRAVTEGSVPLVIPITAVVTLTQRDIVNTLYSDVTIRYPDTDMDPFYSRASREISVHVLSSFPGSFISCFAFGLQQTKKKKPILGGTKCLKRSRNIEDVSTTGA